MRISCGIDTIRISRVRDVVSRTGDRFLERVYTPDERRSCENKGAGRFPSLAARYAAKEAVSKALGTGIGPEGVSFSEIEIYIREGGQPALPMHGRTMEYFQRLGGIEAEVSMSHDGNQAAAICVMQFEH